MTLKAWARYQAVTLLHSFRLRRLGVPVCHALPHAFDVFEEQFRSAEGFFAVLAHLGGAGMYRTHEVPLVRSVLDALGTFDVAADASSVVEEAGVRRTHAVQRVYGVAGTKRSWAVMTGRGSWR